MQLPLPKVLLLALLFFLPFQAFAQAQPCNNYACKMELARKAFKAGNYKSALDLARGAENYDASKKAEVNAFIDEVFAEIEGKRIEAELQRQKADIAVQRANREAEIARSEKLRADLAEQASKRAADSIAVAKKQTDAALSRSERLSQYYEFNGEKAAWAYWRGFFAVINAAGDTLTDFQYETPEPFAGGRAWAKADNQYVLVGDNGKEISGRYDYRFGLSNGKGYFAGKNGISFLLDSLGQSICAIRLPGEAYRMFGESQRGNPKPENFLMFKTDSLYGFIDAETYKTIIEPKFQWANYFNEGLAPVEFEGKWGAIDTTGKFVITPRFRTLDHFFEGLAYMADSIGTGYVDRSGKKIVGITAPKNTDVLGAGIFSDGLALVRALDQRSEAQKFYYIDHTGKKIIRTRSSTYFASSFNDSVAVVYDRKGIGLLNRQGKTRMLPGIDYLAGFSEGLARFQRRSKWGFLDKHGHIVCSPVYDELNDLSGEFAFAKKEGNWGPVSRKGRELVYQLVSQLDDFKNGTAVARANAKSGLVNKKGEAVAGFLYDNVIDNENGTYWVAFEKKWGLLDKEGKMILSFKYNIVEAKNKQIANYPLPVKLSLWLNSIKYPAKKTLNRINRDYGRLQSTADIGGNLESFYKKGKYGFKDKNGRVVIRPKYYWVGEPSEGLIPVSVNGQTWGYINERDSMVIPLSFHSAGKFVHGVAIVSEDDMIDSKGRFIIPPDSNINVVYRINPNIFAVRRNKNGPVGIYNKAGKQILPLIYQGINQMSGNGFIEVRKNGKSGLADSTGVLTLPCEYDRLFPSAYRISLTEQNGRYGLFAPDYGVHLPCKYEQIGYVEEEHGWIRVRQNGKWGWVDKTGKVMFPCRFDATTPFQNGKARVMQAPYPYEFMINVEGEMLLGE